VAPISIAGTFDRDFIFTTLNGSSIEGLNYRLVSASGISKQGSAPASGNIGNFSTGTQKESITLYISGDD
jgi:hypothetical protein